MDKSNIQILLKEARKEIETGNCKTAYKLLTPLLAKKNPEALFLYSMFSIAEMETQEEFNIRRMKLLQASSEAGCAPAIYELAMCYDIGDLVKRDAVQASVLYKQAAEAGHSKAKLSHGLDLFYGSNGIPKDEVMGLSFIMQAKDENVDGADEVLRQLDATP